MIEPPLPPPSPLRRADGIRPMSAFAAAMWVGAGTFGFLLIAGLFASLRGEGGNDQALLVVCQTAAYLLVLFGILRVHAPEASIRAFVGMRTTHGAFYPLGLLLGGSAAFWASWILERIQRRFPSPEVSNRIVEAFFDATPRGRVAMGIAVILIGPLVEELIFRGAIFAPLRRRHSAGVVVVWTAAIFAVVHVEPRVMLPIFLLGLTMGWLRTVSGSIWPSLLLHVGFNGLQFGELYLHDARPPLEAPSESLPMSVAIIGASAFGIGLGLAALVARRSVRARMARQADDAL